MITSNAEAQRPLVDSWQGRLPRLNYYEAGAVKAFEGRSYRAIESLEYLLRDDNESVGSTSEDTLDSFYRMAVHGTHQLYLRENLV